MENTVTGRSELVRRCYRAFNMRDRAEIERLLAPGFTFTSPLDDAIDRAEFFVRCWPNADRIHEHVIERIFVEGDAAYVTYLASPSKACNSAIPNF